MDEMNTELCYFTGLAAPKQNNELLLLALAFDRLYATSDLLVTAHAGSCLTSAIDHIIYEIWFLSCCSKAAFIR
jgi:hypothetical protein